MARPVVSRPRIVLATRDLHPFCDGGIAPVTRALAQLLTQFADVTLITTAAYRRRWQRRGGGALYGPDIDVVFARDPLVGEPGGGFLDLAQAWSASLFDAIVEHFAGGPGPDLIEFPDYRGEGFVTIQARRTHDPRLADTRIVVRAHTTAEIAGLLNGARDDELGTNLVTAMERYCLRHADEVLWPGGDVAGTYERFYGTTALAPRRQVPDGFLREGAPDTTTGIKEGSRGGPLRLLCLGRLERRKGPQLLVRALRGLAGDDWTVTFVGADTRTAPLGGSMREWLETMTLGDPRFCFRDPVRRAAVGTVIAEHDLVVLPSIWECWPNTAREALGQRRPILAFPVGGFTALVDPGVTGWLAQDTSVGALRAALQTLLDDPDRVRAIPRDDACDRALAFLNDDDRTRSAYRALLAAPVSPTAAPDRAHERAAPAERAAPRVTVVIPYFRMAEHLADTLASVRAQTWPHVDVIVVNDGSFGPEDERVLDAAAQSGALVVTQPNHGLGGARNLGVAVANGTYVLPLDADNVIEPAYIEECVRALEADPDLAYVTTWSQYIDEEGKRLALPEHGYTPLGNWTPMVIRDNVAGDGTAVLRRSLFDDGLRWDVELTSYEDWFLYRELHESGRHGDVIPRRLLLYRVRRDSMLRTIGLSRTGILAQEMRARIIERSTQWSP